MFRSTPSPLFVIPVTWPAGIGQDRIVLLHHSNRCLPAILIQRPRTEVGFSIKDDLQANRMEEGAMALLTDEHGFVTEGTGNNLFMVRDGEIFTPKPHNILRGVSRQACMELSAKEGYAWLAKTWVP